MEVMTKRTETGHEVIPSVTVRVWRGSDDHESRGHWYTTDRSHAAYFGDVRQYELRLADVLVLDCDDDEIATLDGFGDDTSLADYMQELGYWVALLKNGEGSGVEFYLCDPSCEDMELIEEA